MPSRSLFYKNLYEEIKYFLKEDKSINFEKIKEKEEEYINKINKELKKSIQNENKDISDYKDKFDKVKKRIYQIYSSRRKGEFEIKSFDKIIKNFIGFNSDIIPGEVVREEIQQLAKTSSYSVYKLEYFTKFYTVDELRKNLLQNNKNQEQNKNMEKIIVDRNNNQNENQKILTDIRYDLDEKENTIKYDASEKNENSIIYNVFKRKNNNIIFDDKGMKDKNNVKSVLFRFIFTNTAEKGKCFRAKFRKDPKNLNAFIPHKIVDIAEKKSYQSFHNINRIRNDFPFFYRDNFLAIDFQFDDEYY